MCFGDESKDDIGKERIKGKRAVEMIKETYDI